MMKGEGSTTKGKKILATSTKSGGRGGPAKNLSTKSAKGTAPSAQPENTQQVPKDTTPQAQEGDP